MKTTTTLAKTASSYHHWTFASLAVLSSLFSWKLIGELCSYSFTHESSSHIILIPFVTFGLVYLHRGKIFHSARTSLATGVPIIAAGSAIYLIAQLRWPANEGNGLLSAGGFALVVMWIGCFVLAYGPAATRQAAFPLLFLLLMVPFPDFVLSHIVYQLQIGSTELTYLIFKLAHVPVLRQGFVLAIPGVTIEVAKECSGIRSSMALFITSLLAGHLFLRSRMKIFIFVLLVVPVAIIKNAIRIATLTFGLSALRSPLDPSFSNPVGNNWSFRPFR